MSIRILSYVFLRWIPGHQFPELIYSAFAIYVVTVLYYRADHNQTGVPSATLSADPRGTNGDVKRSDEVDQGASTSHSHGRATSTWSIAGRVKTLILGIPSSQNVFATLSTIAINLVLVLMVTDFVFSPKWSYPSEDLTFARVGYASPNSASILVRESNASKLPMSVEYMVKEQQDGQVIGTWTSVPVDGVPNVANDFTSTVTIAGLRPDTTYQFRTSSEHSGQFKTAPRPGTTRDDFTFLHSSCVIPNFPYMPLRHSLSVPGFRHLASLLPAIQARFMLFLGDFIYIDVPRRFGSSAEDYRLKYRHVYASPDWRAVSDNLPWIHVYDDHEIANDWDKNETGVFSAAYDAFDLYQASVNPPPVRKGRSYFSFVQGPASFFMLDTRRYRTPFDGTAGNWTAEQEMSGDGKSMLGKEQRADLVGWLKRPEPRGVRWKFVISSVPFTKNWRFGSEDTWAGYLGERRAVLREMWAAGERGYGVVVLSGDRHEFAATKFPPDGEDGERSDKLAVHEFSASPLSMFYLPVRTYRQADEEDVMLKYLPDGNSKFGSVSILPDGKLHYRLFIDGKEAWEYKLDTPGTVAKTGSSWRFWL